MFLVMASSTAYGQSLCGEDSDCRGYIADAFCGSVRCIENQCLQIPTPCPGVCSERLRACVECDSDVDCHDERQGVCDPYSHTCRACTEHRDCPNGSWCTGGHWLCVGSRCVQPPSARWPCRGQVDLCVEATHECTQCNRDEDCGGGGRPYDFCTNRVRCNTTTLHCQREPPLPSECRVCDSLRQQCAECLTDTDCISSAWVASTPFCTSPLERPACRSGHCVMAATPAQAMSAFQSPCSGTLACCDELRKSCTLCPPKSSTTEKTTQVKNLDRPLPLPPPPPPPPVSKNTPCSVHSDCVENGWLCAGASRTDPSIRQCKPCRNDAQCIRDGVHGTCDKATGACSSRLPDSHQNVDVTQLLKTTAASNTVSAVVKSAGSVSILAFDFSANSVGIALLVIVSVSLVVVVMIYSISNYRRWRRCCRQRQRRQEPIAENDIPVQDAVVEDAADDALTRSTTTETDATAETSSQRRHNLIYHARSALQDY